MPRFWRFAIFVLLMQAFASVAILTDMPLARQILGFVCFVFMLGLVTIPLLKLKKISKGEILIFSTGIGLVGIMVIGFIVNSLYPFIEAPLSTIPMLVALNLYMAGAVLYGLITKADSPLDIIPPETADEDEEINKIGLKEIIYWALIIAFPAMAIAGTWIINTSSSNIVLMAMILLVGITFIALLLDKKAPDGLLSLFILSASASLLFMYSLRSFYLLGFDIHGEYYAFEMTLANFHWSIENYNHIYNTCLSITILPTVLFSLLNIPGEYIYKLIFQILFSIMPFAVYLFFKDKTGTRIAFLSAFFMMSHFMFIYQMPSLLRQEISILLFILAMYILFTDRIKDKGGYALFTIFSAGTVVSHYTTSFIFVVLLLGTLFLSKYMQLNRINFDRNITGKLALGVILMVLIWHGLITKITLAAAVNFLIYSLQSLNSVIIGNDVPSASSAGIRLDNSIESMIPVIISGGISTLSKLFVAIGVIYVTASALLFKYNQMNRDEMPSFLKRLSRDDLYRFFNLNEKWARFGTEYLLASIFLLLLLFISILVPFVSQGYNFERLYMQSLVFLAPMCVLGVLAIIRSLRLNLSIRHVTTFTAIIIVIFFLGQTGFTYEVFGVDESISLNADTDGGYLVYPQEIQSATWLESSEMPSSVFADNYASLRLWSYAGIPRGYGYDRGVYPMDTQHLSFHGAKNELINSYVYLSHYNVDTGLIFDGYDSSNRGRAELEDFVLLNKMDIVYDNGGSAVLKTSGRYL
ncbi:hypothetical protein CUJ83_01735 [Methanocella sp. CWC-04]|uniref:DUF2206 domain-containing protein n=1 Tax=Methanooceanicella nereidis TaxID=2052831 RepID=A0AAP2RA22_9EURY|nr:DUF2206 domain-containing protein [Methanocella sp. CWC-04]MCD1293716.1 hypothetical protein [Methanocella sp. CWC-04]